MRSIIKEVVLSFNKIDNLKRQKELEEKVIKEGLEFVLGRPVGFDDHVKCQRVFHEEISNIAYDSRRTGKTTRLVNAAIEKLFETGDIYIPMSSTGINIKTLECTDDQIFIDFDACRSNYKIVQEYLYKRIISRLELEHPGQTGKGIIGTVRAICLRESSKIKPTTSSFKK